MKLLQAGINYGMIIGVHQLRPGETSCFNVRNLAVLIYFVLCFIAATAFLLYDANTFQEYAESFFAWSSLLFVCAGFFVTILQTADMFRLKDKAEQSIDIYANDPTLLQKFQGANEQVNKWTQIVHTLLVKLTIPIACGLVIVLSYYLYFTTKLGNDAFILYSCLKLPFERRTPYGYISVVIIQGVLFAVICHTVMCALGILFGFFGMAMTSGQGIAEKAQELFEHYKIFKNRANMTVNFIHLIRLYTEIKDLHIDFTEIFQFTISLYYVWSLLAICDTLLMCHNAENSKALFLSLPMAFWSFVQIFLFCELGERLTDQYDKIVYEILQSDWYTFPMNVRKILPIFIKGTQTPVTLRGIGAILCTREAFKNVTSGGYSYYTTLRQF